jgi:hypothetical protein
VYEAEDFGAEFTPELREQEASQRTRRAIPKAGMTAIHMAPNAARAD